MIFKQYYLSCLAHASYLLGDEASKTAVVVDPQRDVDEYLADAKEFGLEIRHVFLTHFHADFLAGHLELRKRCGAEIDLGPKAEADFGFRRMEEGERFETDSFTIEVMTTPGHTPESVSYLVYDHEKDRTQPWAVLTGDALFVGDVGRPDLLASLGMKAEDLGAMLYSSMHDKLMKLPGETLVYPAHGAGSMCGKALGSETWSTIGKERANNYALKPMSQDEFIALVTADQPIAPAYFSFDALQNRREHDALSDVKKRSLRSLTLDQVREMQRTEPLQLIDVRDAADYARSHLAGSWNVGLDGKFATWAGSVLEREQPIVVIAEPGQEEEAIVRLGRIGYDWVVGYLEGGSSAFAGAPEGVASASRVTVNELEKARARKAPPKIIDVRGSSEYEAGHIDGAVSLPLQQLKARLGELPADEDLVFVCRTGYRSSVAASLFRAARGEPARDLEGGMVAWDEAHATTGA